MTPSKNIASTPTSSRRLLRQLAGGLPRPIKTAARKILNRPVEPKKTPTLTVVVPVYNVEDYIEETLDSLLSQSLSNWEAIIVDDGSTDGSRAIVDRYAAADDRFKVIHQKNAGLGAARNSGIVAATGKYLTFLDSDDIVPDDAYKIATQKLNKSRSDFAIGTIERTKNGKKYTPAWSRTVHRRELIGTTIADFPEMMMDIVACNRVFRRTFWDSQLGTFPEKVAYEDHRVMVAAAVRAKSIDVLSETTYIWRVRDDQTSISQQKGILKNLVDRIRAKSEAYEVLVNEAPRHVLDAWLTRVLDTDVPLFATYALASDEEYRRHTQQFAKQYVDLAPLTAWENVRWEQRLKTLFIASGRWDDLDKFLLDLRLQSTAVPGSTVVDGQVVLDTQNWPEDLVQIIDDKNVLGDQLTSMTARVESARWSGSGLELRGFAFVSHLDVESTGALKLELVNSANGQRIALPTPFPNENRYASRFANHGSFDYTNSGFIAEIPWPLLEQIAADENFSIKHVWVLEATRQLNSISRTGVADLARRNGSGSALTQQQIPGSFHSVIPVRESGAFTLRFRNIAAQLSSIASNGELLSGSLTSPTVAGKIPTQISYQNSSEDAFATLTPATHDASTSTQSFNFSDLELPTEGTDRLRVKFDDGTSRVLVWGLEEAEFVLTDSASIRKSTYGYIDVLARTAVYMVQNIEFIDDSVYIRAAYTSADSEHKTCYLESDETADRVQGTIEATDQTTIKIRFDLNAKTAHGGPLKGNYTVYIDDVAVVSTVASAESMPLSHITSFYRVGALRGRAADGRPLKISFQAPLNDTEQGAWNQKQLRNWYRSAEFQCEDVALFQCYRGETASDNQLVIYNELIRRHPDMTCFWGVADGSVRLPDGAIRLIIGSQEWYRVLGSARYLCNNIDFDHFFTRRPYQNFLQTFHGHAFKSMGQSFWNSKNFTDVQIDYEKSRRQGAWTSALMPNEESIRYYVSEYDFHGDYLVAGFPRNDALASGDSQLARQTISDYFQLHSTGRKLALYAPTWRESAATGAWSASMFDDLNLDELARLLGPEWTILVRGHGYNSRESHRIHRSASIVDVTDYAEINDLILAADVAILDYSSLRFDWAITEKPMLFFVPDKEEYFELRPALFDFDDSAPGAQVVTTAQVAEEILRYKEYDDRFGQELRTFNQRFNYLSDGKAARRVVDSFFESA